MITSTSNARVKRLVNLKKKKKARDEERVFLVEGIRMFREVPTDQLEEVYVSESFYKKEKDTVEAVLQGTGIRPEELSDTVYAYASDTKTPQGVLCVVRQMEYPLEKVITGQCPMIMVLEHLQDPGNLGTILRTAEGAGVTGIVMDRECVDIYNPKTIRSTMGSIYRMPFCYVEDLKAAIGSLKEAGIGVYAAHLDGRHDYDEEDYGRPCAFLIGNEGNGLSQETAELADIYIKIPMEGQVESLNAAIAASVLMFEAGRQRRRHEG
ncbi:MULTISPECIES: TrmH family RNA methyltransferase [Lachnospiraceae]|uniref:TrmH family RNA methyltransferase n=1 Tax=Lachnospiraceae TaxID=186803 RepID=UPI001F189E84|nr:RNA methyltransferase [Faecalicatena contorta]MCF2667908.1 RNA methyltransferase [Faecalicatena contorta]